MDEVVGSLFLVIGSQGSTGDEADEQLKQAFFSNVVSFQECMQ